LLAAETARDSARVRLRQLRAAAAEAGLPSSLAALHTAASDVGGALPHASTPAERGSSPSGEPSSASTATGAAEPRDGEEEAAAARESEVDADSEGDVDVVAELRARISELEGQLRQARSLQRAQSTMLRAGNADAVAVAVAAAAATARRGGARGGSAGGAGAAGARYGGAAAGALALPGEGRGAGDSSTLLTPAQQTHDALVVPLEVRGWCRVSGGTAQCNPCLWG
jgi:hypothetical protein